MKIEISTEPIKKALIEYVENASEDELITIHGIFSKLSENELRDILIELIEKEMRN